MATCYSLVNTTGLFSVIGQQKCGPSTSGAQFCCDSDDTCLENSICHYTHSLSGGSGYYIGGCTDPNFPEPCSKSCTDLQSQNIVFTDSATGLWACCYQQLGDNLDCSNPGNETFYAPPPQSLTRQAASSSTTSASATSSTSSTVSSSASSPSSPSSTSSTPSTSSTSSSSTIPPSASTTPSSPSQTPAPSNSLSAGAKAGIGVAAAIAGLGIIVALGFFFLRKRNPRRQKEDRAQGSNEMASSPRARQTQLWELNAEQKAELDGNARSELEDRMGGLT